MNPFASYMAQRRKKLAELSLLRWWLLEYLGRGMLLCGFGILISCLLKPSAQGTAGLVVVVIGLLIIIFTNPHSPIVLDFSRKE